MARLTDEEIRILQRARIIQDRLEAEKLEAGEELPAKKVQPKIRKQKITNHPPVQQREAGKSNSAAIPSSKAERTRNMPVDGEKRAVNLSRESAGRTNAALRNTEAIRKPAKTAEESAKKIVNTAVTSEAARTVGTGNPVNAREKRAVRQPVATVEEKRNKSLAGGPVRQPVGTIDTVGRKNAKQSAKTSGEKAGNPKKGDVQQQRVYTENGKDQKQLTRAEAVRNPSKSMVNSDRSVTKERVNRTTVKKTAVPERNTAKRTTGSENLSRQKASSNSTKNSSGTRKTTASGSAAARRKISKKKKTEKWKIIVIALLITFLIAAIAGVGAFIFIYSNISKTNYESISQSERSADVLPEQRGVKNILLLGTDERNSGEASRSDAIIVLSINENKKKIIMTSILRDSYVTIPGYGKNRINHAYQMGGAALMIQTIEENFKIPIDSYAKVDFFSFMGIIDKLGGVPITVTQEELGYLNGYISEINALQGLPNNDGQLAQAGSYQLNGKQALAYSRIRYIGTDFARTERQRTVLDALFQQLKTASPKELYEVATTILPDVTTNIGDTDLTKMMIKSIFYMKYDVVQNRIPMDGTWSDLVVGGQEVLGIDFEANQAGLKSIIYEE